MHLNHVQQMIPRWFRAGSPVYLRGPIGVGKTTTAVDAVKMMSKLDNKDYGCVVINGGNLNIMDATGFLILDNTSHETSSRFSKPFWWFTDEGRPLDSYAGGLVIVDEMDKAPIDCKKILGECMESGRFASHRLPPGFMMWGTGNRAGDRSGTTKELDHLINRRVEVEVQFNLQAWQDWAMKEGIHPTFVAYSENHSEVFSSGEVPKDQQPFASPRSFVRLARELASWADDKGRIPTDSLAKEHAAGRIGPGAVASLFSWIELGQDLPSYPDIISKPDTCRIPQRADAQMLVCFKLAAHVDEDAMDAACTYMGRLPKEFSVSFAKAACRRDPNLINTAAIARWCATNATLMTAIADRS